MIDSPVLACIALGSNLGDRAANIAAALESLRALPSTTLITSSRSIETDPVGPIPQPTYLNAAAVLHTSLQPRELLTHLLNIERSLGRNREAEKRWGPRTLDLDLLLYGDLVLNEPGLTIPHPRMHERAFVLVPLAEIAPDFIVPTQNATVADLLLRIAGTQPNISGSN